MQTPSDNIPVETDTAALKRASVRGVAVSFGSQGVRFVLQFGTQVALAHFLLPSQFGLVAMVTPVLSLVQVFSDLGLAQATIQRSEISHDELSALFWISLGVGAVLALALILASPLVAWFYQEPALTPLMAALGSLVFLSGASAQQIALMNRRMRFGSLARIDISCAAMAFVIGLSAAWAGFGSWSLVFMQAANSLTILILAWSLSDWRPSWPKRGTPIGGLMAMGGHLTGFNILIFFENSFSTVLIGRLRGSAEVGLYDRAFRLVIVPYWQISLPIDRVAVSLLSRLKDNPGAYARAHLQLMQGLLLVAGPGLIWASLQAAELVPILLGPAWVAAGPMVGWLTLAALFMPFSAAAYWLFTSQGLARTQLRYGILRTVLLILSSLIGINWNALGVAIAYAAFSPFLVGIPLWGATRQGPVNGAHIVRAATPIMLGYLAAAGAQLLVARIGFGTDALMRAARLGLCLAASYGGCAAVLLALPQGRRILTDLRSLTTHLRPTRAAGVPALAPEA